MNHAAGDIIRYLLIQLNAGSRPSSVTSPDNRTWPIYYQIEPDRPDNCITVQTTQGVSTGRRMTDGKVTRNYGFQVRIRGTDEIVGYNKAKTILEIMEEQVRMNEVLIPDTSTTYLVQGIVNIGDIIPIGTEQQSGRSLFTINALAVIKQYPLI